VERISGELKQALILHGVDTTGHIYLNTIDNYSPHDFIHELSHIAKKLTLSNKHSIPTHNIQTHIEKNVPNTWSFDYNLLHLAVMNAIHNCLKYAKNEVNFHLDIENNMLKISVSDDSG
jgi:signal transduction histidine kinase